MTSTAHFLFGAGLALLASSSFARPLATLTTTTTSDAVAATQTSSSSSQQDVQHHLPAVTIAVAVVVPLIITVLILTIVCSLHRKLRASNRLAVPRSSTSGSNETTQGFGGWFVRHFTRSSVGNPNARSSTTSGDQEQQQTNTSARSRRRRGRRNQNALQRTDSGRSVKTLPEYKTSLGENEMVLYKTEMNNFDDSESDAMLAALTPNAVEGEVRDVEVPVSSRRVTVITQTDEGEEREEVDAVESPSEEEEEEEDSQEALEAGQRASLTTMAASGFSALRRSIRRSMNQSSNDTIRVEITDEGGNEERNNTAQQIIAPPSSIPTDATPTYDSIYPSLLIHEPVSDGASSTAPAQNVESARQRPGVGAIRNLFRRQPVLPLVAHSAADGRTGHHRFASTASVLTSTTLAEGVEDTTDNTLMLMPTRSSDLNGVSRPSTSHSGRRFLLPFPTAANGSSVSLLSGASTDSTRPGVDGSSVSRPRAHHRNISSPMSIRRLQFEAPAAGFTDQQMAFLASVESLDKYGIPLHNNSSTREVEGRSENANISLTSRDSTLPSFEQLARQEEEAERQRQAQSNGITAQAARQAPTLTAGEIYIRREQEEHQTGIRTEPNCRLPISPNAASNSESAKQVNDTTITLSTQARPDADQTS